MIIKQLNDTGLRFFTLTVLFSGFITNFFDFFPVNTSTLVIDIFYVYFFVRVIFLSHYRILNTKFRTLVIGLFYLVLLSIIKLFVFDTNFLIERFLGFRNLFIYPFIFLIIPYYLKSEEQIVKFIIFFTKCMLLICLFAISQNTLNNYYPEVLLKNRYDYQFDFFGYDTIRINGLIGNPINFTGFAIIFYSLSINLFLYTKKLNYFLYFFISLLTLYLTYSRIAYLGFAICSVIPIYIIYYKSSNKFITYSIYLLLSSTIFLSIIFNTQYISLLQDSIIYQRFFGSEATTLQSNEVHMMQTVNALSIISENPIFGVGLGTQGESAKGLRIISDGSFFQLMLELGVPLFILYIAFVIFCIYVSIKYIKNVKRKSTYVILYTFWSISLFFLFSSFVNSIFTSRIILIIYWILFGVILAQIMIYKNRTWIPNENYKKSNDILI